MISGGNKIRMAGGFSLAGSRLFTWRARVRKVTDEEADFVMITVNSLGNCG